MDLDQILKHDRPQLVFAQDVKNNAWISFGWIMAPCCWNDVKHILDHLVCTASPRQLYGFGSNSRI